MFTTLYLVLQPNTASYNDSIKVSTTNSTTEERWLKLQSAKEQVEKCLQIKTLHFPPLPEHDLANKRIAIQESIFVHINKINGMISLSVPKKEESN